MGHAGGKYGEIDKENCGKIVNDGFMLVSLILYHKSKIGQALMYIQRKNMVCREFHMCHDLFLDQNENDNAYSTPLRNEALYVDRKNGNVGNWFVSQHIYTS